MCSSASVFSTISTVIPPEPFIFVRHGSTDWSPEAICQGPQNLSLNEQGKAEAASIADILASVTNDDDISYVMITSNLKRAVDTAKIIAEKTHIPIFLEQGLQERYYGDFSLVAKTQINSSQIPSDAESEEVFQHRIFTVVNKIFTNERIKNSKKILVSHGEVFKYLSKLLTKRKKTISRGGIVMFIPSHSPHTDQSWSICYLKKKLLSKECYLDGKSSNSDSAAISKEKGI